MTELPVLRSARAFVRRAARTHLENIPVGRWGVPFGMRDDILAICAFSCMVEDCVRGPALEGSQAAHLQSLEEALETCAVRADHPVFVVLGSTIRRHRVPLQPFRDMLAAARLDAGKHRYDTLDELADYCRRSSCPVGRLVLHLADNWDAQVFGLMDALCTGVKLARIWQRIPADHARGRSYIPRREAAGFGVDVDMLVTGRDSGDTAALVRELIAWSRGFFEVSRPLMKLLRGRMRFDSAVAWLGGVKLLDKTARLGPDALSFSSALDIPDRILVFSRALSGRY